MIDGPGIPVKIRKLCTDLLQVLNPIDDGRVENKNDAARHYPLVEAGT